MPDMSCDIFSAVESYKLETTVHGSASVWPVHDFISHFVRCVAITCHNSLTYRSLSYLLGFPLSDGLSLWLVLEYYVTMTSKCFCMGMVSGVK